MAQVIAGSLLFLGPGLLPAYVRHGNGRKTGWISFGTSALQFAFLILVCSSGATCCVFPDAVFSMGRNPYLLLYIFYFVVAYGLSLQMAAASERRGAVLRSRSMLYPLSLTALFVILLAGIAYDGYAHKSIAINEVCPANLTVALDAGGEDSDYIELYNPSFTAVSLNGWYLADCEDAGEEYRLRDIWISPRSYLVLFADGGDDLCFKLKVQGETLTLADDNGNEVDKVEVPPLDTDVSYARLQDGTGTWTIVKNGTPGAGNAGLSAYILPTLDPPVFSVQSGFYEDPVTLSLSAGSRERIYYTTDGSVPTTDSRMYTQPLSIQNMDQAPNYYANISGQSRDGDYRPDEPVDKAVVINAIAANAEGEVSDVASQVYFIGYGGRDAYDGVGVMSVVGDPEDFFSEDRGIYVLGDAYEDWTEYGEEAGLSFAANYTKKDRTAERKVTVSLFDRKRRLLGEERIGIRIRGGASRSLRQKGFNFYAREAYGEDVLRLAGYMMRTSGSLDTNVTMLRDVFNQSLVADRRLDIQPGEPCVLFLNGEYWGLYNLQARFSAEYYEERYGLDGENLVVIKQDKRVAVGRDEDMSLYENLVADVRQSDMSLAGSYEEIGRMMDLQSFIDHYCFEIYIGNTDWPLNNVCCWRSREKDADSAYADGRWRWGIYDTDESVGIYDKGMGTYSADPFSEEAHWFGSPLTTPLMSCLILNETFRKQFSLSFMDMVNHNFAYGDVHDKLYRLAAVYAEPMVKSYHRFNGGPYDTGTFWDNIAVIDEFYRKRPDYVVPYFAKALGLSGTEGTVTLQTVCVPEGSADGSDRGSLTTECGTIRLNTIEPVMTGGEWQGRYFTDYPVTATAIAADGYRFAGWEGTYESSEDTIEAEVSEEGIDLRAVFVSIDDETK